MKHKTNIFNKSTVLYLCGMILMTGLFSNCEDLFREDLPGANSQADNFLPTADFSYIPDASDFKSINFTDLSAESNIYLWDFNGEATSTLQDPTHLFTAGEGTYPVTLTVKDSNGASDSKTIQVDVVDKFVPLTPTILNGDMENSSNDWKISFSNGWDNNGFESSSDGSWLKYDGSDNGSKTRGAKWNLKRSADYLAQSNTRHAYQAVSLSGHPYINPKFPNRAPEDVKYILEFEYAIKTEAEQSGVATGGNRIIAEILDGHFTDGFDAYTQSNSGEPLLTFVANEVKGKTVFTTVKQEFTPNASGEVSIFIWAVTLVDLYVDNVKIYPAN